MGNNIKNFVTDFQDMYVMKKTTIKDFPAELSQIEVNILDKQITELNRLLSNLTNLTYRASKENYEEYLQLVDKVDEKINYISNLTDMVLYLNTFYDMSNVIDVINYDLMNSVNSSSLVYDRDLKGVTLRGNASNYQCSHSTIEGTSVTFYNTNSSYHSGISLESPYLDVLKIKSIYVRKADGTTLNLPVPSLENQVVYVKHDFITSTQIVIEFEENVSNLPQELREYYKSLKITLIDYEYQASGSLTLTPNTYNRADILSFIIQYELPSKCYINMDVDFFLRDVNKNLIDVIHTTLPIGLPKVCKPLDQIDFNQIDSLEGVYIGKEYSSDVDLDVLLKSPNHNEIYIVYYPKINSVELLNKNIKLLNNQGIAIVNKNIRFIDVQCTINMYSFSKNSSPILKMIAGTTKYG